MACAAAIAGKAPPQGTANTAPPRIVRLWRDTTRVEQLARLNALELQSGDKFGERAWELAHQQWRQIPEDIRVDLPSPHVFGRILGLFRTGATLKTGKLLRLELSAQEIGELIGYSKATVEAAIRWLGCEPIEVGGDIYGRGIGMIHSGRRTAWAYLEGQLKRVYRTSRRILTNLGRLMLGLGQRDVERQKERREQRRREIVEAKKEAELPSPPPPRREQTHVAGLETVDEPVTDDVGRSYLQQIKDTLGIK
ncbi:hypothetical protein ACFL6C_08185 [Myxococcota bacterium]